MPTNFFHVYKLLSGNLEVLSPAFGNAISHAEKAFYHFNAHLGEFSSQTSRYIQKAMRRAL